MLLSFVEHAVVVKIALYGSSDQYDTYTWTGTYTLSKLSVLRQAMNFMFRQKVLVINQILSGNTTEYMDLTLVVEHLCMSDVRIYQ